MRLPILVFDIETITDLKAGAHLYGLSHLSAEDMEQALNKLRRQDVGTDFQRLPLHEIVCISGLWIDEKGFRLFSFSQQDNTELGILQKFLSIFEKRRPVLVSWNGSQFDLPVIAYRAMYHGLSAPNLFDQGELDQQRRFSNYQNRYHHQHVDLMDVMAMFNGRNFQKLDDIAQFLGLPGKREGAGYLVPEQVKLAQWTELETYCEGDVINTWLIYLRWVMLKGQLLPNEHTNMVQQTIQHLQDRPKHQDFLKNWERSAKSTAFSSTFFHH
ncbi:3'-5' exonuclease [Acinetobacter nectaris]|uniref:3'-5' exonuclease n=1 Tax=Acinetobacter nectaris TaxID=1219382 RepID=UPI001F1FC4D4|nr:3'-5' exonuclease [Acinetobacter nectaris]MCF8998581.1 3'-5' exonuclease [Acinetobacter nectaris]MCF9027695.1 3'-5' exonuclease [Acinetobacter nectaris]